MKTILASLICVTASLFAALDVQADTIAIRASADAFVLSGQPDANFGSSNALSISPSGGGGQTTRTFIKFDLSSIPPGVTITNVAVRIFHTTSQVRLDQERDKPRVWETSTDWDEGSVTWNNQPSTNSFLGIMTLGFHTYCTFASPALTELVRSRISGTTPALGLTLRAGTETRTVEGDTFKSREFTSVIAASHPPELLVGFNPKIPNAGLSMPTQTIDFETIPGVDVPFSNLAISTQFQSTFGVSFSLEGGGFPILAEVGNGSFAFEPTNTPAAGQNVGRFFLADNNANSARTILISNTTPVSAASGVLLDIDREDFLVEALDGNGVVVATNMVTPQSPYSGNGRATPWRVQTASPEISVIRVKYIGTRENVGWGFDNFSPGLPLQPAQLLVADTAVGARIEIRGSPGGNYRIERTSVLPSTEWLPAWSGVLTNPVFTILDTNSFDAAIRFYRAAGLP